MEQRIIRAIDNYAELEKYFDENRIRSFLLVSGCSMGKSTAEYKVEEIARQKGIEVFRFSGFHPNPAYESVVKGVRVFRENHCDSIIAIGGGSAMDVAKCIKLYSNMDGNGENGGFLTQAIETNSIKLLVIPTTAGTGSEATRFAVIYYNGEKQSITHESIVPETVLMDSSILETLPLYQKKSTMLDAFCHSIESFWSIDSTDESKEYSKEAIALILENMGGYLSNSSDANEQMLRASHIAGKAINITQTTAGHAMCYKLTSFYGIAHGHAAALCVKELWPWMVEHTDQCVDARGKEYLDGIFAELGNMMGDKDAFSGAEKFKEIMKSLEMPIPHASSADFSALKLSVNPVRLKNNPIELDIGTIDNLYHKIFAEDR